MKTFTKVVKLWKLLTIAAKCFIVDVWHRLKYTTVESRFWGLSQHWIACGEDAINLPFTNRLRILIFAWNFGNREQNMSIFQSVLHVNVHDTVFLIHVSIRQMPTRLSKWKAKSLYHVGTFLPTWFILPLKNCKDIFRYICFTLYLQQTVNNWESAIVFIDRHCLWCFFFSRY